MILTALTLVAVFGVTQAPPPPPTRQAPPQTKTKVNALAVQVALDRAGFSPGALDGRAGANTNKALEAYRAANGAEPPAIEALSKYSVTDADVAGPFETDIPSDLVEQSKLKSLGYRTLLEALAERYHATPALLQRLNPKATFDAGEEITVPNVDPMLLPATPPTQEAKATAAEKKAQAQAAQEQVKAKPDVTVTVSKDQSALTVTDAAGKVMMYAPVTTGSDNDPLPIGDWKVNGVSLNPSFRYNPDLFWDADPAHTKAMIPAGPNNPVGLVWVDISKEHYGIHGSPEPANIGRSESHGCVRLTNWDALRLAAMVKPGTPVVFQQ
ncbi:MAG: L,D-transpeptidase [Acidobacteria bacterium]|nr:L,D-transpeptidase [Acidobacteriota bacterium]